MNTVLTVAGIVVTVILGGWGLYLALQRRYPGEITFVSESVIWLFDDIVENLPDIAITYQDKPISPDVVLIRGAVVNTGRVDLTRVMTAKPITLSLPQDCKWLGRSVIGHSPDVVLGVSDPGTSELAVEPDLLRCGEFVRFQALASMSPEAKKRTHAGFRAALSFAHRIRDTQPIRRTALGNPRRWRRRLLMSLVMCLSGAAMFVFFFFVSPSPFVGTRVMYKYEDPPGTVREVTAVPREDGSVRVRSLDGKYRREVPAREFVVNSLGGPERCKKVARPLHYVLMVSVGLLYVVLPCVLLGVSFRRHRRDVRLAKLLGVTWDTLEA
jgi:hypothetical protein